MFPASSCVLRCRRRMADMPAQEGAYATSAQLHAAQSIRTAAGLHRLVFHLRAALCGAVPVFNARMADSASRIVDGGLDLSVEETRRAGGHVSAAGAELRLRRRALGDQRSRRR